MLSIRTQDRMALVPYDSAMGIYVVYENGEVKEFELQCGIHWLGTYSSKERALEVLDEIEEAKKQCDMIPIIASTMNNVSQLIVDLGEDGKEIEKRYNEQLQKIDKSLVYAMPSD